MKMTALAAGALLAAAFAFPAPSQAQTQDAYRIGHDKGYQDGLERAVKGRAAGREQDLARDPRYRKGDAGYKKAFGPRQEYIAGYRDGYEQAVRGGGRRSDPYDYGRDGRYGRERDDDFDDDVSYEE
jgi:hypothetical protein